MPRSGPGYDVSVTDDEDELLLPSTPAGGTRPGVAAGALAPWESAGSHRPGDVDDAKAAEEHTLTATDDDVAKRLDVFLAQRLPAHSRTWLARHIDEGHVTLLGGTVGGTLRNLRAGLRIEAGDVVAIRLLPREAAHATPERIPLTILYEDPFIVVIDKPPGLTVHPGSGQKTGTLANAIAYHFGELSQVQGPMRPGIVHRLDKDTSGVILVAKDDQTHAMIANQFRDRTVRKEYHAVCRGVISFDADLISGPIGPDRRQHTRMAIRLDVGRPSETYFEVIERFAAHTYVRCMPKTGRTHQIRVHMMSAGHAIISDRAYGGFMPALAHFCPRQALHARSLTITHPSSADRVTFEAPIPADMASLLEHLRQ